MQEIAPEITPEITPEESSVTPNFRSAKSTALTCCPIVTAGPVTAGTKFRVSRQPQQARACLVVIHSKYQWARCDSPRFFPIRFYPKRFFLTRFFPKQYCLEHCNPNRRDRKRFDAYRCSTPHCPEWMRFNERTPPHWRRSPKQQTD